MPAKRWHLDARGATLIREQYDSMPATITRLAARLDVPRWQVRKWARALGVARVSCRILRVSLHTTTSQSR